MGQAKARGSREERIAAAQAKQTSEEPINVECKTCKAVLNGFSLLKHLPTGAVWQKRCECGAITTALVQSQHSTLQRTFASTLALTKEIAGSDKKCSVSFLEKTVDSIETGIVRF